MKQRKSIFLGIVLTGVFLFFLVLQAGGVFAQNVTFEEMLNIPPAQTNNALTPTTVIIPEGMSTPSIQDGNSNAVNLEQTHIDLEQVKKNESIINSAKVLVEKANKNYITPGWWHSASKIFVQPNLGYGSVVLSDGSPVPSDEWREDSWTLLDENGQVIQEITLSDFGPSIPLQVGIYKAEENTVNDQQSKYTRTMDSGFLESAETSKDIVFLESKDGVLGEEPVVVYTSMTKNEAPIEFGSRQVTAGYTDYYFSKDSGLLLLIEHYDILLDGQTQLVQRIETLLMEKIDEPPTEVLKYLE